MIQLIITYTLLLNEMISRWTTFIDSRDEKQYLACHTVIMILFSYTNKLDKIHSVEIMFLLIEHFKLEIIIETNQEIIRYSLT